MSHLESLIAEYLEWRGFPVRRNTKVGRRAKGGWEMELDIVGFHPQTKELVHFEPSVDGLSWAERKTRYEKKFEAGQKYILKDIFPWLPSTTSVRQVAVFWNHPKGRDTIAGGTIVSIDELMAEIRANVVKCGPMERNAISENFPLLRTIQMSHVGYNKVVQTNNPADSPGRRSDRASRR